MKCSGHFERMKALLHCIPSELLLPGGCQEEMIQMSGGREMSCRLFLDGPAEMMFLSYDSSFFSREHAGKSIHCRVH